MNSSKVSVKQSLPKEVWIGWFSSLTEAYNMAIYTFVAPFIARLMFQNESAWGAVFLSFCLVFAGTSIFYPAGATYFGFMGDKEGRNQTCIYSTFGLAIATGMMGLIPIHSLGDNAWIWFFLLICAQYFFSGGEYSGSIVFSLEHSQREKNGLMSGMSCLFAVFGIVAANGVATLALLSQNELWVRGCFVLGAGGGLISYFLKNYCRETPAFTAIPQACMKSIGILSLIKARWAKILGAVLILGLFNIVCSFIFVFLPLAYSEEMNPQGFNTFQSLIVYGLFLVISGFLADRIGVSKIISTGAGLLFILAFPLCYFCHDLLILQLVLTILACLIIGPIHSWMYHQFDVQERCRGIFISSAIAMSVFGGSTVPICLMIFERFHSVAICCLYPSVMSFLSFIYLAAQEAPAFQGRKP